MIYCRGLDIIFFKTKKVGGTSFEIALSKYCDEDDIVTPLARPDEKMRANLGFQGPTNHENQSRSKELVNLGVTGDFDAHAPAKKIHKNLGQEIFNKSTKISIHREPIDVIVSFYWMQKNGAKTDYDDLSFREWLELQYQRVKANYRIAPIGGPYAPDILLNYETLADDINEVSELPNDFLEIFDSIRAKGDKRPPETKDPIKFLKDNDCEDYIKKITELADSARASFE